MAEFEGRASAPKKGRPPFANALFFPTAALYAALIVPWWALTLAGVVPAPAGLGLPAYHAHELLFGFALAVVAGYLLGPQSMRFNLALLIIWCSARITFLLWPESWATSVAAGLFALGFASKVVPRFARSAKKWRNRAVVPLVIGLAALCASAGPIIRFLPGPGIELLLIEVILLLAGLMYFMGGRIIAPAVAGHIRHSGGRLDSPVQPGLEGASLVCFGTVLLLAPLENLRIATGVLLTGLGILTAVRLARWHPWKCGDRPDLLALLVGYAWLSVGLILLGTAFLINTFRWQLGVHALTIGALGTLTLTVMARTRMLYRFRDPDRFARGHYAALLISAAAIARVVPGFLQTGASHEAWNLLAAACWSGAFLLLFTLLVETTSVQVRDRGLLID